MSICRSLPGTCRDLVESWKERRKEKVEDEESSDSENDTGEEKSKERLLILYVFQSSARPLHKERAVPTFFCLQSDNFALFRAKNRKQQYKEKRTRSANAPDAVNAFTPIQTRLKRVHYVRMSLSCILHSWHYKQSRYLFKNFVFFV